MHGHHDSLSVLSLARAWVQNFAAKEIGIPPQGIQLLFRGRKKNDSDVLSLSGVKNGSSPILPRMSRLP